MSKEILNVVDAVSNEKGVDKEIIFDAIETALERDNFMSAEDAKKFGIIDEIQTKRAPQTDTKPE